MIKRICQLPLYLSNQIAAGEVIERPASVLKELLENSLDAESSQIDVTIEKGGLDLILVQDNGLGIHPEDLHLALSPHATSKIGQLEDLESLTSLGFRGEALASIGSVSRLRISSKTEDNPFGWTVYQEGREGVPEAAPIAQTCGTRVEVRNLFYNTPVRRKFLRTEKSEQAAVEEVFKRIALSYFKVGFSLTQNGKILKQLPPCQTPSELSRRVAILCGQSLVEQGRYLEAEANGLQLKGWIGVGQALRSQCDLQYGYVNQRMVRDKLLMHAVKEAYREYCPLGRHPAYLLYLTMDPGWVDVNVHPTKHEVRFRESRTVHAFVYSNVKKTLEAVKSQPQCTFDQDKESHTVTPFETSAQPGKMIYRVLYDGAVLVAQEPLSQTLRLVSVKAAKEMLIRQLLNQALLKGPIKQKLHEPVAMALRDEIREERVESLRKIGFEVDIIGPRDLVIRALPAILKTIQDAPIDLKRLLDALLRLSSVEQVIQCVAERIGKGEALRGLEQEHQDSAAFLIQQLQEHRLWEKPVSGVWREFSLDDLLSLLL